MTVKVHMSEESEVMCVVSYTRYANRMFIDENEKKR